jgi:hypothetical protein
MSMTPPPYLTSIKNVPAIFTKIKSAGTPPKFNNEFLKASLGFSSSSDRAIVPQLKFLKFIDDNNAPTDRFNDYKSKNGDAVLALAIREAYSDVFLADGKANELSVDDLKSLFASLTGKGDSVSQKMASTFKSLCTLADFQSDVARPSKKDTVEEDIIDNEEKNVESRNIPASLTLRHDVHVHLPATSDVSVYKAIFRAINDELSD